MQTHLFSDSLNSFLLIAGPCVIESESHALKMAEAIQKEASKLAIPYIFKASYDKANRTSIDSFRGLGIEEGLRILEKVKKSTGLPVLTDVHEIADVVSVAEVVDVLQIPAFLCRQTDLLIAASQSGRVVNVKKGQFLSPYDMKNVVAKVKSVEKSEVWITERGVSFGYGNLVVDMRSFPIMLKFGCPVIFDVTHSLQYPGGLGNATGGDSQFIEPLARAGIACGVDGMFMEVHDNPSIALSDGPNALPLERLPNLLNQLKVLDEARRSVC